MDIIGTHIAVAELDSLQRFDNGFHVLAFFEFDKSFDVLQDEVLWSSLVDVVLDVPKELPPSFRVCKALLLAGLAERLTWETCAVKIYTRSC